MKQCDIMKLEKINVTVSADAKKILVDYQKKRGLNNLDSALQAFLLEHEE